jgi:hypothetical protein
MQLKFLNIKMKPSGTTNPYFLSDGEFKSGSALMYPENAIEHSPSPIRKLQSSTSYSLTEEPLRPQAFVLGNPSGSTDVLSGVGAFICCTFLFLVASSVYLAWRVYVWDKKRFSQLKQKIVKEELASSINKGQAVDGKKNDAIRAGVAKRRGDMYKAEELEFEAAQTGAKQNLITNQS